MLSGQLEEMAREMKNLKQNLQNTQADLVKATEDLKDTQTELRNLQSENSAAASANLLHPGAPETPPESVMKPITDEKDGPGQLETHYEVATITDEKMEMVE